MSFANEHTHAQTLFLPEVTHIGVIAFKLLRADGAAARTRYSYASLHSTRSDKLRAMDMHRCGTAQTAIRWFEPAVYTLTVNVSCTLRQQKELPSAVRNWTVL